MKEQMNKQTAESSKKSYSESSKKNDERKSYCIADFLPFEVCTNPG
jgi:hypothetical protein